VKRYAQLGDTARAAVEAFRAEVESGAFPTAEHSYAMADEEWRAFLESIGEELPQTPTVTPR
jgi:hypothetical protein